MLSNNFSTTFNKKKISGIRSIVKHPSIDIIKLKTYGGVFLQKYFLNTGKAPNKMVAFAAKDRSFSKPLLFIIYDLKMQPAIFFEFKDDLTDEKFIKFVAKFFKEGKFTVPKKRISESDVTAAEVVPAVISGIMGLLTLLTLGFYYFKSIKYSAEEYYVNTTIENELNKELFKGQKKQESGFEMFANLENYINLVLNKKINSLILCGPPGMSKTYMVRRTLYFAKKFPGKDYVIEKGSALGLSSVYQLLYDRRTKLLVLDDFDSPLANEDVVNLMKAVTDSYGKRIVSLSPEKKISGQAGDARGDAPVKFEFKGQVIIITNKKKSDLDLALRSRSPVVEISFDTKQVLKSMDKLIRFVAPQVPYETKQEVLDYIKLLQKNNSNIDVSFRSIKGAIDSRVGNPSDWKSMTRLIVDYKGKPVKESLAAMILSRTYKDKKIE